MKISENTKNIILDLIGDGLHICASTFILYSLDVTTIYKGFAIALAIVSLNNWQNVKLKWVMKEILAEKGIR